MIMDKKFLEAKNSIEKTLSSLENILSEDSPTGLKDGISIDRLDDLIDELNKVSSMLENY